eukprot:s1007_g29.t1
MLLTGQARSLEGATQCRVRALRHKGTFKIEEVALYALGNTAQAVWTKPIITVQPTALPSIERTTVRIAAPEEFRKQFIDQYDRPRQVVTDMAQWNLDSKAAALTGGHWSHQTHHNKHILIGFLNLPTELADKFIQQSGKRGIFVSKQDKIPNKRSITWITRNQGEANDAYHSRCYGMATQREQGLYYRKSDTPSTLGLPATTAEVATQRTQQYIAKGVPRQWQSEELQQFLESMDWKEIDSTHKARYKPEWRIRAKAPIVDKDAYHYAISAAETISLILAPTKPKRADYAEPAYNTWQTTRHKQTDEDLHNKSNKTEGTKASTGRQRSRNPVREVKATVPDPQTQDRANDSMEDVAEHKQSTAASTKGNANTSKAGSSTYIPGNPEEAIEQGWVVQDVGGTGDCMYRACAAARAKAKDSRQLTPEETRQSGAELRLAAVEHCRKHKERLKAWFAPDVLEEAHQRSNKRLAASIEEWCNQQELHQTWGDGLALHCLAEKFGLALTVWKKHQEEQWQRYTFAPKYSTEGVASLRQKEKPLTLVLESNHYKAIHPPANQRTPKPWLLKTTKDVPTILIDLTGAGSKAAPGTPGSSSLQTYRSKTTFRDSKSLASESVHTYQSRTTFRAKSAHSKANTNPPSNAREQPRKVVLRSHTQATTSRSGGTAKGTRGSARLGSLQQIGPKQNKKQQNKQRTKGAVLTWTCRLCQHIVEASHRRQLNWRRLNHLRLRHPHHIKTDADKYCKFKADPVIASDAIPQDARDWNCPWCNKGLPPCDTTRQREASIRLHLDTDHKGLDTSHSAILKQRAKLRREDPHREQRLTEGHRKRPESHKRKNAAARKLTRNKHDLVQISPHWDTWRQAFQSKHMQQGPLFTCRKCWRFGPYHISHDKCTKLNISLNFDKLDMANKQYLAKQWKVSVKKAEAVLLPKHIKATKALATAKFKRLVQQGIEPHPGPSYTKRRDPSTINICSLNT